MTISYRWLLDYLPQPLEVDALSRILTSIGLEVEAVETIEAVKGGVEGLVIGEVLTCEPHPNADKLKVTTVTIGGPEVLNIVCGAPNVAAGQKVVVAPVGATVHPTDGEAFAIKKAKIRGSESEGMLCAGDEIGLNNDHAGILVLPADAPVGTAAKTYFNIPQADYAIHIGLTPNRSDAMSHIGVARDVCAYLIHHNGQELSAVVPSVELPAIGDKKLNISVNLEATEASPRYTGVAIAGVKVGPSPEWLQQRLKTIGVRSINNIVDATNYVLHEWGQPLHAFDADKIKGGTVNVRFLPEGSTFVTLDGEKRNLRSEDLMICDTEEGMCIAGVFGGQHSGITEATTDVFLESAYFHPTYIRRTSLHHGLRTDAATHFEKGVDINNVIPALERAAALIVEIAGGSIASEVIDIYPQPLQAVRVAVTYEYIRRLSGKEYSKDAINEILEALGFTIENEDDAGLEVLVPSNKTDVLQPADIVEEILRIDGLDQIEIPSRLNISLTAPRICDRQLRDRVANQLCGNGFQEIVTNSIINSRWHPERTDLVRMLNSLSSELDAMRPDLLESGLEVVQYNVNRKSADLLLFEIGNVYRTGEEAGKYIQEAQLGIWVTGNARQAQWNEKAQSGDWFFVKGIIENLILNSGISSVVRSFEGEEAIWKWKNQELARLDAVSAQKLSQFEIKQPVLYARIHWDLFVKAAAAKKVQYKEIPRFPAVQRDLAIVLDKAVTYQEVKTATEKLKLDALQSFGLFDVFESEKLGTNRKSYALNYTFQLQDRTLTDTEIDALMKQLVQAYQTTLKAEIRS